MQNIKGWISTLRPFAPRVLAMPDSQVMVRGIASIIGNKPFQKGILYVGYYEDVEYRFRTAHDIIFLLIGKPERIPDRDACGHNTVILLGEDNDIDQVYDACRAYLDVQEEVIEKKQRMMESFLSDHSMQSLLDDMASIIGFPLMIIDNSYCLIGASDSCECEDPLWQESVRDGYCSYEFVSRFNQLSEIDVLNQGSGPVLAGCLMSPMRRCIVRMTADHHPIGYLLSVESQGAFDRAVIELLEQAARILSKAVSYTAMESGIDLIHATWNVIVNAIDQTPKSDLILREYLSGAGFRKNSCYYLLLFSLIDPDEFETPGNSLNQLLKTIFPFSAFSFYKNDAVVIIDYKDGENALTDLLKLHLTDFIKTSILISISDMFTDFSDVRRYYDQAKQAQHLMQLLDKNRRICRFEDIRFYDMLASEQGKRELPLHLNWKEIELYRYDQEHGTEFFRTLYSYIKHSKRLQDVSDELHIHKNTVSYRINRIRELFDLNLNDAPTRIGFYLAYQTLRLSDWNREEGEL